MDEDLLALLSEIGLTEYQSRAYVAAVTLGTAGLPDLAEEAGIPQQRVYDVVDDLEARGLVEVVEGDGGKRATAVPPEQGLTALKRQRIDDFTATVDAAVDRLEDRLGEVDPAAGYVSVVNTEASARRHVRGAIEAADWWLFCSLPVRWLDRVADDLRAAVERGTTVRVLVHGEDSPPDADAVPEGALGRHRPAADLVVAADREYAVFRGVGASVVDRPALVTRDPNLVSMFQRYSEQFWQGSRRLRTEHPFPRRYLEPWRALQANADLLDDGAALSARVEGTEVETGREGTWSGPVVDHELEAGREADHAVVIPEVAQLVVDTDEGELVVGGWDATLEDVAATGLELSRPDAE